MKWLPKLFERRSTNQAVGGDSYWTDFAALRSGPVNPSTAQSISAVYACVQAISETVASLPLILYRRNGDDRERASDHPLYRVLHEQANEQQTALEFREWMQACVLLRGNAYARILTGWDGQVRQLIPLSPDRVQVLDVAGKLAYDYTTKDGKVTRLLAGEVLTSADTLEQCSTMRAAAHVDYLQKRYTWPIVSEERATGCTDGRMAIVAAYRLPADCIHAARAAGAGAWCAQVRKARAALRAKAAEAYRRAAAIERARKCLPPPGQGDFFGERGAA